MKNSELSIVQCNLIDLGKIVLKCQIIEHHLASLLALCRHKEGDKASDTMRILADCRTKTLDQLINELKQSGHPLFTEQFVADMKIFCKSRNLIIHNLMLSTEFHDAFISKQDHLKLFLDSFSGLADILQNIVNATTASIFPEYSKDSNSEDIFPVALEKHNMLIRHFMSEKWDKKNTSSEQDAALKVQE